MNDYITKIINSGDNDKMVELENIINKLFNELHDNYKDIYDRYKTCIYEIAYDCELNDDMAHTWVKSMEPLGEYWTIDETTNAMHNLGYNVNPIEYYTVSNMMINDYNDTLKDHEDMALHMAKEFIDDIDANEHKVYKYWKYISKK